MWFSLLGSLEVLDDEGKAVEVRGGKPRQAVAVLLLQPNTAVVYDSLIDAIWGDEPPNGARQSLQFTIHRLRQSLSEAAGGAGRLLWADPGGYRLEVQPGELDWVVFEERIAKARAETAAARLAEAARLYDEALGLWRGPVLDDFPAWDYVAATRARLGELHLTAAEESIQVALRQGRHGQVLAELEMLVRAYPTRERLRAALMLALYRSGRQADALAAYRSAREGLAESFGIEPSVTLRRLERQILTQDPALDLQGLLPGGQTLANTMPAPARAAVRSAGRPGAVRRRVSVVVFGLVAPSGDPEVAADEQSMVTVRVAGPVARFGGQVRPGLGTQVLAVFGAERVRDDDPERAVRAALAACEPDEPDSSLRAGVATGTALLTDPDADLGVSALGGTVVDSAGELHSLAEAGGVLVGEGTVRATRHVIAYTPVRAGGWQARSVRSHIGAAAAEPGAQVPLVARDRELGLLREALRRVRQRREPWLVTVLGAAGVGKTRLVGELGRLVDAEPDLVAWRQSRCQDEQAGTGAALGPLIELLAACAGIEDRDAGTVAAHKLDQAVTVALGSSSAASAVARTLQGLLHAEARSEIDLLGRGGSVGRRAETVAAWTRFIGAAAATRPTVLVVDDLHLAGSDLLDALEALPDQVGQVPLLLVVVARPELLTARPGWGGGKHNAVTVTLGPLPDQGSVQLLEHLLAVSGRSLSATTQAAVLAAAGGNPLYLEEYVRLLVDLGEQAAGGGRLPIPERVEQLITARVDALPALQHGVLADLAILGAPGGAATLMAIGSDQDSRGLREVQDALAALEGRELLVRTRQRAAGGERLYLVRHPLVSQIAAGQRLRRDRAGIHRRIAAWLQSLPGDRADRIEQTAQHYQQTIRLLTAEQPGLALPESLLGPARAALRTAGHHLMRHGAFGVAASWLQQALAIWPPEIPDRPMLLLEVGRALVYSTHTGAELLSEARDAAVAAGDAVLATAAEALLGHLARISTRPRQTAGHLVSALARPVAATGAHVEALAVKAIDLLVADHHAEAITVASQVVDLATTLGMAVQAANGRSIRSHAKLLAGDPTGLDEADQALADLDAAGFPMRVFASFGYAHALYWSGDLARCAAAVSAGRAAAAVAEAGIRSWFDVLEAALAYHAGCWTDAQALAGRLLTGAPAAHRAYLLPLAHVACGRVALGRGLLDQARTHATAALQAADTTEVADVRYRQVALGLCGRIELAAGNPEQASSFLDRLLADLAADPARGCATTELGLLLVDLGRQRPGMLPGGLPPVRWHAAVGALASGDLAGAVDTFARIGATVDEAAVRLRLARHLTGTRHSKEAARHAELAAMVFRKADASSDLAHVEALLATDPSPTPAGPR